MQLSPNIYFSASIVGLTKEPIDITQDNMGKFVLVENSGASLPYIVFSFFTTNEDAARYYTNINEVEVKFGTTAENAETFRFRPLDNDKNSERSERGWEVIIGGFIGNYYYMMSKDNASFGGTSLEVLNKLMLGTGTTSTNSNNPKLRGLQTNIEKVNEEPINWRMMDETPCAFAMDTVLHMDIRPSFPLIAIDKYGKVHVNDCMKLMEKPKWTFTPFEPKGLYELQFINNFNVDSHRLLYDIYSGYSKVTKIPDLVTGKTTYKIADNKPIIASTKKSESVKAGPRNKTNKIKSPNVHSTYQEVFEYNTSKLMSLSSQLGLLVLMGYYKDLKATDSACVKLPKGDTGELDALEGYYVIDSIQTRFDFRGDSPRVIITNVFITRDNPNDVENYVADKNKEKGRKVNVTKEAIETLCGAVSDTRVALATCSRLFDGTFFRYCMNFLTATKTNLLRMFSVGGVTVDFNSQAFLVQSLLCMGNMIMNAFTNMLFPDFIAYTLRDFLIDKPSMRRLLSKYINMYVPSEIQNIVSMLADSLCRTQDSLNSIAKANNITARRLPEVSTNTVPGQVEEPVNIVGEIITEFEQHTQGVDVPFPVITLTESQELLSKEEIKDYIADETISNLTELGYMDGVDKDEFKEVLMSNDPQVTLSFATIDKINKSAGNRFMYRYWGTYGPTNETLFAWSHEDKVVYTKTDIVTEKTRLYNSDYSPYTEGKFKVTNVEGTYKVMYGENETVRDEAEDVNTTALAQLTSYYITKGFKDKYRTLPCTKLISATKNARLYFACPQMEENIKFYINSKRVVLDSFPIDLGYVDIYGNKVLYNVYYTTTGYNSNSTMLEIRQG